MNPLGSLVLTALAALPLAAQEQPSSPSPEETLYQEVPNTTDDEHTYYSLEEAPIREALAEVLSLEEFQRLQRESEEPEKQEEKSEQEEEEEEEKGWWARFVNWLEDWLKSREPTQRRESVWATPVFSPLMSTLVYVMAAAIVAAIFVLIFRSFRQGSQSLDSNLNSSTKLVTTISPPGEVSPEEYWSRAVSFGNKRNFKAAIREILLGAMSAIERAGLIRHRRGLTNRDYYWAARSGHKERGESFSAIAKVFELVYYGRREATADGFQACCQAYRKSFLGSSQGPAGA